VFFQLDDKLAGNPKVRKLTEGSMFGDYRGLAALGLWSLAGTTSQDSLLDGLLSRFDLTRLTVNVAMADELAGLLVDAGLWHAAGHDCRDCDPVPDDHWRFHQWWQFKYDPADKVKAARAKRAELKDRDLRDAVWARDALTTTDPNEAACRYCGKTVRRHDHRSPDRPAPDLDHVDPSLAKGAANLVVACRDCSRTKGQRTPAQAGLTLLPAPRPIVLPEPAASPLPRAAEAPQSHPQPTQAQNSARGPQGPAEPAVEAHETGQDSRETHPDPDPTHDPTPSAVHGRTGGGARTRAGQARAGEGLGSGRGAGEGPGGGEGAQPSRRSRRRRGRGDRARDQRPAPTTDQAPTADPAPSWDAGPAPEVATPGRFGSPWYGGRRGDDDPEARCPDHDEHLPCRRCRDEAP